MDDGEKVTRAVERTNQLVRRYLAEHLRQIGVTEVEAHLLARLAAKGPCSVAELQRSFGLRPSTLTNALDRLERRAFVTRTSDAADRRTFRVELTRRGTDAAREVVGLVDALEERVAARVSRRQLASFHSVLAVVEASLE